MQSPCNCAFLTQEQIKLSAFTPCYLKEARPLRYKKTNRMAPQVCFPLHKYAGLHQVRSEHMWRTSEAACEHQKYLLLYWYLVKSETSQLLKGRIIAYHEYDVSFTLAQFPWISSDKKNALGNSPLKTHLSNIRHAHNTSVHITSCKPVELNVCLDISAVPLTLWSVSVSNQSLTSVCTVTHSASLPPT